MSLRVYLGCANFRACYSDIRFFLPRTRHGSDAPSQIGGGSDGFLASLAEADVKRLSI